MKTLRVLTTSVALLLPPAVFAVTETWDGGGGNDNFSTGLNWADNTAPVSSLTATDLVFSGANRKTPNAGTFSAHSVAFDNIVGFLIIDGFSIEGTLLNVGAGGVSNDDPFDAHFALPVSFSSAANVFSTAAAGALFYHDMVTLPTGTLVVGGAFFTELTNISGTSTVRKISSGEMRWAPTTAGNFDLEVNAGTVTLGAAATMNATASIAVNGTGVLNVDENLTLNNSDLTRDSGALINIAAGKQLTAQNGADIAIDGSYSGTSLSTITVTGSGSTFGATGILGVNGGSIFNATADSDVTAGSVNVGTDGNGTLTFNRAALVTGNFNLGLSGYNGVASFTNGATGTMTNLAIAASPTSIGTNGTLNVQTGSDVTVTSLQVGTGLGQGDGVITIEGADSAGDARFAVSGAGDAIIGRGTGTSTGLLRIRTGGRFESSTGVTTVLTTGRLHIDGGVFRNAGFLNVAAGRLDVTSGYIHFLPSTSLYLQSGGQATFAGLFSPNVAALSGDGSDVDVSVLGPGSTLTAGSILLDNSNALSAKSSAAVVSSGAITLGSAEGGGTLIVFSGASVSGGTLRVGSAGGSGLVLIDTGATGALNAIIVASSSTSGSDGTIIVGSGASVTGTSLEIGSIASASTGLVSVNGANSALSLTGPATATIGANLASAATLRVQSDGVFNSGTGQTTVNLTGQITISGGTMNALGNLTLNGGQLTRNATGTFALAPGKTLTVQAGGDANFTGDFAVLQGRTVSITGSGSTLTVSGATDIGAAAGSPATVNVSGGGVFTTGTSQTTVHETGALSIDSGGTFIVRGDMLVKSALNIGNGGTVILAGAPPPAPALSLGSEWDFSALESTDSATVVPEPGVATLLLSALGFLGMRRGTLCQSRSSIPPRL